MSLNLLLDEDSQDKILISLIKLADHNVTTIGEAGLNGTADDAVLAFARQQGRILITHNGKDFRELHKINPFHPGLSAIHQDGNPKNRMGYSDIVQAINNIDKAEIPIINQFIDLNHWR